jgi:hypothetical protein
VERRDAGSDKEVMCWCLRTVATEVQRAHRVGSFGDVGLPRRVGGSECACGPVCKRNMHGHGPAGVNFLWCMYVCSYLNEIWNLIFSALSVSGLTLENWI